MEEQGNLFDRRCHQLLYVLYVKILAVRLLDSESHGNSLPTGVESAVPS